MKLLILPIYTATYSYFKLDCVQRAIGGAGGLSLNDPHHIADIAIQTQKGKAN